MFDPNFGRSGLDRRSGVERRKDHQLEVIYKTMNHRTGEDRRRSEVERRSGWVRVSKYSSAFIGISIEELNLM